MDHDEPCYWWRMPVPLAADPNLSPGAKLMYLRLLDLKRITPNGHPFPSSRKLQLDLGIKCKSSILLLIKELQNANLITLCPGSGRRPNVFGLNYEPVYRTKQGGVAVGETTTTENSRSGREDDHNSGVAVVETTISPTVVVGRTTGERTEKKKDQKKNDQFAEAVAPAPARPFSRAHEDGAEPDAPTAPTGRRRSAASSEAAAPGTEAATIEQSLRVPQEVQGTLLGDSEPAKVKSGGKVAIGQPAAGNGPEPTSKAKATTRKRKASKPDPIWEAVVAAWCPSGVPASRRAELNKVVKDLEAFDNATPTEITARTKRLRDMARDQNWPKPTVHGLVKRWEDLHEERGL